MTETQEGVPVQIRKLRSYRVDTIWSERDSPFCLLDVMALELDDPTLDTKRQSLINGRTTLLEDGTKLIECSISGCRANVTEGREIGSRSRDGQCKVAQFCLKQRFEQRTELSRDARETNYKDILDTCQGFSNKYSAGNYCPQIDCELSAGFSIDGVAGTAGVCAAETRVDPNQLAFDV